MVKRRPAILVCGLAFAIVLAVHAQDALDASLSTLGRMNAPSRRANVQLQRSPYTLNQGSGEFEFNASNAFNDPTYNIYERYRRGPIDAPFKEGTSVQTFRSRPAPRATPMARTTRSSHRSAGAMAQSTYRPGARSYGRGGVGGGGRQSAGRVNLRAPTYRVTGQRVR